jgi:hypothetical protein
MRTHDELNKLVDNLLKDVKSIRRELSMLNKVKADNEKLEYIEKKLNNIIASVKIEE